MNACPHNYEHDCTFADAYVNRYMHAHTNFRAYQSVDVISHVEFADDRDDENMMESIEQ